MYTRVTPFVVLCDTVFLYFLGFPTERWEMEIVASKFERDGLIDYKEFVNSLKDKKPVSRNSIELHHRTPNNSGLIMANDRS